MSIDRLAVLITSFNRRDITLASLACLFRQRLREGRRITVFLVDDGCTDGTGEAVRKQYPDVRILQGDGTLFWNGGERLAFGEAMKENFDAFLLFNDDTILYENALEMVLECAESAIAASKPAIVVGSARSPLTGEHTYGGFTKRARGLRFSLEPTVPDPVEIKSCDTMNGNVALIPLAIARVVGNIEEKFSHLFGDVDYGLRARKAGFHVLVAPGYVGECERNTPKNTWQDASLPLSKRWKNMMSRKGFPIRDWLLFTRRHYGWRWPWYAASPYLRTILSSLFPRRSLP